MLPARQAVGSAVKERECLEVIVEAERAWQAYAEGVRSMDTDTPAIGRLWLKLWLAERRRDELIRAQG